MKNVDKQEITQMHKVSYCFTGSLRKINYVYIILSQKLCIYSVILSVLDPRKCEYLKDYSLDFEHAYMTTYLAS